MPDLTDYAKNLLGRALCARVPALPSQAFLGLGTGGNDLAVTIVEITEGGATTTFRVNTGDGLYHAILARILLAYLLTRNFLVSSSSRRPIPKPNGRNQYSTGTIAVSRTLWNLGTYVKKMAMTIAKIMAGRR